jgi:hypothetical protein
MKFSELLDALNECCSLKCNIYFENENECVFTGYISDIPYALSKMYLSAKYPIEWIDKDLLGFADKNASGFVITLTAFTTIGR